MTIRLGLSRISITPPIIKVELVTESPNNIKELINLMNEILNEFKDGELFYGAGELYPKLEENYRYGIAFFLRFKNQMDALKFIANVKKIVK